MSCGIHHSTLRVAVDDCLRWTHILIVITLIMGIFQQCEKYCLLRFEMSRWKRAKKSGPIEGEKSNINPLLQRQSLGNPQPECRSRRDKQVPNLLEGLWRIWWEEGTAQQSSPCQPICMMHLSYLWLILSAFFLKVRCFSDPEQDNLFSLDDFEEAPSPSVADLVSTSFLSSNPNSDDPWSSSSLSPPVTGFSNLFSETDPVSNDDLSTLFNQDNAASTFAMTDATLLNACATEQILMDGQQPLISRDSNSPVCLPPAVVSPPLSPDTLQLFEDPLGSLQKINPSNSEENPPPPPSPSPDNWPSYPGHLDPEEQEHRQRNPGGLYHNTEPIDGESWQDYTGEVIPPDEEYQHCEMLLRLGYIYPLCCRTAPVRPQPLNVPEYYPFLLNCDLNTGTRFWRRHFMFALFFFVFFSRKEYPQANT